MERLCQLKRTGEGNSGAKRLVLEENRRMDDFKNLVKKEATKKKKRGYHDGRGLKEKKEKRDEIAVCCRLPLLRP